MFVPRLLARPLQFWLLAPLLIPVSAAAQGGGGAGGGGGLPSIESKTTGMEKLDGYFPLYWDGNTGKIWLEIPAGRLGQEFLYVSSMPWGLGSNDIGLDRSQLGGEHVVRLDRVGPKVLLVEPNYRYRAVSDNPDERLAVEQSFAQSILWGFRAEAETGGRVLVDATDFALRDAHGVIGSLQRSRQGSFRLDPSRSALYRPSTKAFPKNSEIEVELTFTSDNPGPWVRSVTPTAGAVTVHERHSLIELPPPGFKTRKADPRSGFFGVSYADYAVPIRDPIQQRLASHHRLAKRDPNAPMSDPVTPIVYYLDRGAPEPVRSALLEGARWWNQAFEAAGYRNAFRVDLLPEGADPMDVRYNTIQWVHRSTRGWSYGSSVTDPRTGEIIKGHVSLGSLRVRQDYLIAEGLTSPYVGGDENPPELEAMALARIRQLAAHEVGHTLGLAHNYVSSSQGRASVMDYPHPLVKLGPNNTIDLSDAYATGIGEWDKVAISWGYGDFAPGTDEGAALNKILADARDRGITFLTDQDARPAGSVHPNTHLWDNGADAVTELRRMMEVRRVALARFGETAIRRGMPMATIEEVLVPLYLHHRYQVEAVTKLVGGSVYSYTLRGDGQPGPSPVDGNRQRQALDAALETIKPEVLVLPANVLRSIPPRPAGFPQHRELFGGETGMVFDPVAPAVDAADMVLDLLLQDERAARLVTQSAIDDNLPGLGVVIDRILGVAFETQPNAYQAEIGRGIQRALVEHLIRLAQDAGMPQVRAIASYKLAELRERVVQDTDRTSENERAHRLMLAADVSRFLDRQYQPNSLFTTRELPPGMPIGSPATPPPPSP